MRHVLRFLVLLVCVCSCLWAVPLIPAPATAHDLELKDLGNGEWEVHTTGADPYFSVKSAGGPLDLDATPMLSMDYFCAGGVGRTLVFVGAVLDLPHLITTEMGRREGWAGFSVDLRQTVERPVAPPETLRITTGQAPGIVLRFRNLQARAATEAERQSIAERQAKIDADHAQAERLRAYFKREFPGAIEKITADTSCITISGKVGEGSGDCLMAEVPMWEDVTALKSPAALHSIQPGADGKFTLRVERSSAKDRDLLLSGWALVKPDGGAYQLFSALRYADEVAARAELPPAKPLSKKGLGGCDFAHPDIKELGIHSVTINIILNDLLSPEPGPGKTLYTYAGRTWYSNDAVVATYDRYFLTAVERGLMVSAIVLLPPVRDSPPNSWIRSAAHPDADSGAAFVMPDFTRAEGVNAYAAAMNFVAERYTRPDGRYGRIHHWILHNEINSGFFWTSAGTKTDLTYLALYHKSLRVAHLLTRQYDPNAKAFISLEHCWGRPADVRSYAGRDLMEYLVSFSKTEGDFPWGVAFHPYPQDIFNPRTWEDSEAPCDFAAPFITYKNIEVLDAWARQERVAYRGQPREIQLSEQGLNSPDYSEKSLRDQSAGMAYAWKKIEPLPTVSAFQYHLWADDRGEGGLRLGLRKFGDDPQDPHGLKPIWQLYQALGTPEFEAKAEFAKEVLGIKDWAEVPYRGEIRR